MHRFNVRSLVFAVLFSLFLPFAAHASLTVAPLTWNIIGLDSNDPLDGPNRFPIGARVCSDVATANVSVNFVWDTANANVNLRTGSLSTINIPAIGAGSCADAYFEVEVTRTAAAFDSTRRYHITATDGSGTFSSPTPREVYVEHLISQSRNSISDIKYGTTLFNLVSVPEGGGMSLLVGETYIIQLHGGTATQGYNQFEAFINFPNTVFQILDVETSYSADNSPYVDNPNDKLYADSCLWENDPNSPNYRSCVGGDFKAGGSTVITTYTIKIISGGGTSESLNTLLYDFSGSSYHYNADFGTGARIANIIDPTTATISKSFSPNPTTLNGVSALTFTLTNPNPGTLGGYNFVDNLPANLVVATPPATTTTGCGTPTLTAVAGSSTISFSNGTLAANSNCVIKVNVTPTATGLLTNTTNNLFIGTTDTGDNATAPLTVNNDPPPGTGLCAVSFARWTFPTGFTLASPAASSGTVSGTATATPGAGMSNPMVASTNSTTTADGTTSWGTNGSITTGATLVTANDEYYEFGVNTTGVTSITLAFDARFRGGQGPTGIAVFYGTAPKAAGATEASAAIFNSATVLTTQNSWQAFGPLTVNTGLNSSGLTYFRIYSYNSGQTNGGQDSNIDNVTFTGCTAGVKPAIAKSFSPDPIAVNGVSTLTFTLTNTNAAQLTGATFTDTLPAGLQVAAVPAASTTCTGGPTWAPAAGSTTLTFGSPAGGTIPASGSCTVSVDVTATTAGAHGNVSGFLVTTETGTTTTSVATDTLTAVLPPAIAKQFAPNPILAGATSTLTFTITNDQDYDVSGVAFSDTFPVAPGAMVVGSVPNATTSGCGAPAFSPTGGAASISFSGGTIAGGGICIVTVDVTAPVVGTYNNTSGNVSHIINGNTVNGNTATDSLDVESPDPSISLLKQVGLSPTGPWSSYEAVTTGPVYYRFTIENTGDVPLNPISLTDDTLDVSACNATLASTTLPVAVAANDNHIVQCVVGPVSITPGSHTNTAHATGTFSGTPYDSDDSLATYATTGVTLDKTSLQTTFTLVGDVINYNYVVTNSGFATLAGPVTVSDDKATVTCPAVNTVGDLDNFFDPGESVTCTASYMIVAGDISNASVTNTATASVDGVNSNSDSVTVVLSTSADVSVLKTLVTAGPYTVGQSITYTLFVANAGPSTATNIQVTDTPSNLTITSVSGGGCVALPCTIPSLASGADTTITITATINAGGAFDNTATVDAVEPDPDPVDNTDSTDNDGSTATADLSLDKSVDNATPSLGANVVFTITVSNAGPDPAPNVVVRDLLPAGLTYVSDNGGGAYVSGTGVWTIPGSIASPGSASLQITATVTSTGTISNYAQITGSGAGDPDSTPNDNSTTQDDDDTQDLTVPLTADLSLDKVVDDATPALGQNVVFTISVSNAGPDAATGVVVSDPLPAGLTYVSDTGAGAYVPGTGVWTIPGSIAASGSAFLQITATVTATGTTSNYAQITASGQVDPDSTPNDNSTTQDDDDTQDVVVPSTSDLSLDKTVDDDTPALGQNVVFTITVTNGGPDPVTGVVVEDALPAGLTYVSDNGGGAYVSGTGIWTIPGSIANGGTASLQITATVTATGALSNYTQVTASGSTDPDSTPNDDSTTQDDDDTQGLTVPPTADLSLDKSVDDATPALGQNVIFTITVSNAGPDAATGVVVSDLLPAGLTYVSDSGSGAYVSGTGVWTIPGSIATSGSASLQITATVTATGTTSNHAQITASGQVDPDSTPNDNSTTQDDDDTQDVVVPGTADLSLDKTVDDDTPALGQNVVFTITVTNGGPDPVTGVVVEDVLPAGLTYVSDNGGGAYVSGTGIWTVPGSIANGGTASLQITATVTATGAISNYTQVTASGSSDPDSTPNDDSTNQDDDDTQGLTVPATADLSLDKSVDDATPALGQNVVFTITVSNAGPDAATGVVVSDLLPAGLTYVSDSGSGAYVSGTGVWTIPGSIATSGSAFLQITATVTATGTTSNYTQITASGQVDPDSTPNDNSTTQDDDDTQDVVVPSTSDLSLDKTVDDDTPALGQNVVFTITVTNGGPDPVTGVVVEDALPAGLTYVSDNGGGAYVSGTGIWTIPGSIANAGTASLQITATVTGTGTLANYTQVTASGSTDPDSSPNDDSTNQDDDDTQDVTVPSTADLSLDKSVDDATPALGQNVVFTITVSNAGPDMATSVTVSDLLPAGLTYVSDNGSGAYVSGTGVWSIESVPNGGSASLQITATVTATGTTSNYAQITASAQVDPDSTPNDNSTTQDDDDTQNVVVPGTADLSLDKTVDDDTPAFGQNVVFTITVSNAGPDPATGVVVEDLLPAGLTYVSDNGGGAYVSGTGVWTIPGSIASLGAASLQITATVTGTGAISNYAQVTASTETDPDSTPDDDSTNQDDDDTQGLTVPSAADLSLTKNVDDATPALNQNVVFTITVTNDGPDNATGVVVEDQLPAGLTYVSDNGGGAYVSGTGVWTVGALANGASASLQITATVTTTANVTNTSQVTASGQFDPDSTPDNDVPAEDDQDSAAIGATAADLSLDKIVDDATPAFGQTVVFTITVSNGGPDPTTGVIVEDVLPAGLTYVSDNGGGAYVSGTGIWTVGSLANGASSSLQITATVASTGTIANYAQVTASSAPDPDSTPNDDSDSEDDDATQVIIVPSSADLSLMKTVDDATPALNQNVVFTITVTNAGPDAASGVAVSDLLPAGLTYVSDNSGGAYVAGTGVWTIGGIANAASASIQITATVNTTSNVTNTAQVSASGQSDPDSTPDNSVPTEDDQDSAMIGATAADLSLGKIVNNPTPTINSDVVFTITVTNGGPGNASGVIVRDQLPAGLTYVSDNGGGAYVPGTGVWTAGAIANGASASLQITATVTTFTTVTNVAEITGSDQVDTDSTPDNGVTTEDDYATASVDVPGADLSLLKTVSDTSPALNTNITYTLTLTNGGPDVATNVTVYDQLPAGLTYVSSSTATGSYSNLTYLWSIPAVGVGQTVTLQIVATVTSTSPIVNMAQVQGADQGDPDSTPANSVSSEDDQASAAIVIADNHVPIPTASELGLLLCAIMLAMVGMVVLKRVA